MDLDDEFDDGPYQGYTLEDVLSHAAGRRYVRDMIEDNEVFTETAYQRLEELGIY